MPAKSIFKTSLFFILVITVGLGTFLGLHFLSDTDDDKKSRPTALDHTAGKLETDPDSNTTIQDANASETTADEEAERMGMNMKFEDPKDLVEQVMKRMSVIDSERDIQDLAKILGNGEVNTEQLIQLNKLFEENRMKLRNENALELLGEVKAGKISRWALYLSDSSKIQIQTSRQPDGSWKIDHVILPLSNVDEHGVALTPDQIQKRDAEIESKDSLVFSSNFLKSLISQNFKNARNMANPKNISDAKIAGLCILFEDGAYHLREDKPLQAVRMTDLMAAFYVNVKSSDGSDAQFSVNVLRENVNDSWLIDEINLDKLLADYAERIAGGDVYYTPLIKNPNGGDLLVIYFEFDSKGLTERTKTQLEIVANLLKLDSRQKMRVSGHTDGIGSDTYNQGLSKNRAASVKEYLTKLGIKPEQIITESFGFTKPRRPELSNEDGTDDPNARRANRRTEIYLDF